MTQKLGLLRSSDPLEALKLSPFSAWGLSESAAFTEAYRAAVATLESSGSLLLRSAKRSADDNGTATSSTAFGALSRPGRYGLTCGVRPNATAGSTYWSATNGDHGPNLPWPAVVRGCEMQNWEVCHRLMASSRCNAKATYSAGSVNQ